MQESNSSCACRSSLDTVVQGGRQAGHLFEADRAQQGDDEQAQGGADDDGEGGGMQDFIAPPLILCIVGFVSQAGLDEHERSAAQRPLYGSLHHIHNWCQQHPTQQHICCFLNEAHTEKVAVKAVCMQCCCAGGISCVPFS